MSEPPVTSCGGRGFCAYPWQQLNIDLTGEVAPCCFWSGYDNTGRPLGNTNEKTPLEIWNGPAWRELRAVHSRPQGPAPGHPCHECLAWQWSDGRYPGFSWPVAFSPETGLCHTGPVPERITAAAQASEQPVVLSEDGEPLPWPDAVHDDIRQLGGGRYSVWGDTLYFSSSDGSDPATNGRLYELRCGSELALLPSLSTDCASGRNLLVAHEEYERGAVELSAAPTMLSFISTADCNIDCPACSQNTVRQLSVQHRRRTEDDVLALVPYLHQFIWHGGEPYLIAGFRAFIDGFRREHNPNLTFGFTSNGTLLDAAELDKLTRFPRINASVSVDSFVRESFERIRAGANYDTVLAHVLAAMERYDAPDFVVNVGLIVTKGNLLELPTNLAFAMQHDIGLNLSPVVVYPVTERLDVFRDFHAETDGWAAAIGEAEATVAWARGEGRVALKRVDPIGMLRVLRDILARAAARHAEVLPLAVHVEDPCGSLPAMRRPGLIFARDDDPSHPLAYVAFDRGAGDYQVMLPRIELRGSREVRWNLVHDLFEPMGVLDAEALLDEQQRPLAASGWRVLPTSLLIEIPPFSALLRPRNPALAQRGLPRPGGRSVLDPAELHRAYLTLRDREAAEGRGLVPDGTRAEYARSFGDRLRPHRHDDFVSLVD